MHLRLHNQLRMTHHSFLGSAILHVPRSEQIPIATSNAIGVHESVLQDSSKMAEKSSTFTKIGGGLVEIAALTALIGSATAESLTLGNKGAPGLAWAASSTFGALSVIKACVAGATPGWLQDSLGVRNTATDLAIGLSFDLDSRYKDREDMARKNLGDPIGVMCGGCHVHVCCISVTGPVFAEANSVLESQYRQIHNNRLPVIQSPRKGMFMHSTSSQWTQCIMYRPVFPATLSRSTYLFRTLGMMDR